MMITSKLNFYCVSLANWLGWLHFVDKKIIKNFTATHPMNKEASPRPNNIRKILPVEEKKQDTPFIKNHSDQINAVGLILKRVMDIIVGSIGTLIYLIIFPIVYVALKIDSSGPTLFKQKRVGQYGRLFNLYKFRSMYAYAEEMKAELVKGNVMTGFLFKMKSDPRITPVGRFLRKTSIDEIPQFWNVLKGEMSLVGTRPPTPDEVENYHMEHLRRIALKPGITGLWQISGRNQIKNFDEVVELDCKYLENWRFLNDIKILFRTVIVVMQRKGAI